jgi:uncharacterized tannase-like protein DUF6351
MRNRLRGKRHLWWLTLTAFALLGTGSPTSIAQGAPSARVSVLSSRAELVTGGDALVRVALTQKTARRNIRIALNDFDVTAAFTADESRSGDATLTALITGLRLGVNRLTVGQANSVLARATLVNYPVTGPVISGPHERPFVCETERFKLPSGRSLGSPLDENCSATTKVEYAYRSTAGGHLKPLVPATALPADLAHTRTNRGTTVPYIVRIEVGTINRSIYQILMLHDPTREQPPDFRTRPAGWNDRLIYRLGGGCAGAGGGGWYRQGIPQANPSTTDLEDDGILAQGYAVASASLNVFANNCNDLLAAETMMMVKERFIEAYGQPRFTIGWGGSGGAVQGHQIADNYPGLIDGVVAASSFPDVNVYPGLFTTRLLYHYFDRSTEKWTVQEQLAASGLPSVESLTVQGRTIPDIAKPGGECGPVPSEILYHPTRNPRGTRCTVYDHLANVYGRDSHGLTRRPLDNVGVQYGLHALNAGAISKSQFLDLNEKIGGIDADANFISRRTRGDLRAIRIAYESGRILNGGGGLASTPLIDYRDYRDLVAGDQHMRVMSFVTRARLLKQNGHADNQVMIVDVDPRKRGAPLLSMATPSLREALRQMDTWLEALSTDGSDDISIVKVRRAKPADLVDACFDESGRKIIEKQEYNGTGVCNSLYPPHALPNLVAGMPLANDVLKCQLKAINTRDYKVEFTPQELTRLRRIFSEGVCDYSKPGVEQRPLRGTWLSFGPSPVNRVGID